MRVLSFRPGLGRTGPPTSTPGPPSRLARPASADPRHAVIPIPGPTPTRPVRTAATAGSRGRPPTTSCPGPGGPRDPSAASEGRATPGRPTATPTPRRLTAPGPPRATGRGGRTTAVPPPLRPRAPGVSAPGVTPTTVTLCHSPGGQGSTTPSVPRGPGPTSTVGRRRGDTRPGATRRVCRPEPPVSPTTR